MNSTLVFDDLGFIVLDFGLLVLDLFVDFSYFIHQRLQCFFCDFELMSHFFPGLFILLRPVIHLLIHAFYVILNKFKTFSQWVGILADALNDFTKSFNIKGSSRNLAGLRLIRSLLVISNFWFSCNSHFGLSLFWFLILNWGFLRGFPFNQFIFVFHGFINEFSILFCVYFFEVFLFLLSL